MPAKVDPIVRRGRIAEAVIAITATRGIEHVSLRDVAATAGISMGQVQHYFRSKDDMLVFACEYLVDRTRASIAARERDHPHGGSRAGLRTALVELLPLDEERRLGTGVWLSFLARAGIEPRIAEAMRETWASSHEYFAARIRHAVATGELAVDADPDRVARELLALADGLVGHVLVGHYTAAEATAAIDNRLDELFVDG